MNLIICYHINDLVFVYTFSFVRLREAPALMRILTTSACPFSDADIRAVHENCMYVQHPINSLGIHKCTNILFTYN